MKKNVFRPGLKAMAFCAILVYLFTSSCKDCSPCQDGSKYDTLFINPEDKCSHVVLRRNDNSDSIDWNKISKFYTPELVDTVPGAISKMHFAPINIDTAIQYIRYYNEKHNSDLMNTSFIDFNKDEILLYIIEVMNWLKRTDPTDELKNLRVYLADNGYKTTTILIAVSKKGEIIANKDLPPIDFGGLCPPPDGCITDWKAELLRRAIDSSNTDGSSRTVIRRPSRDGSK